MAVIRFYRLPLKKGVSVIQNITQRDAHFSLGTWIFSSIIMKMKLIHQVN